MEKTRMLLSAVCYHQPIRQSWLWSYSTALPPLGWGSLRALTQNLGLQHEKLKNLWVLCPRNQIFCPINPLKNEMQRGLFENFGWVILEWWFKQAQNTGKHKYCWVKIPFLCVSWDRFKLNISKSYCKPKKIIPIITRFLIKPADWFNIYISFAACCQLIKNPQFKIHTQSVWGLCALFLLLQVSMASHVCPLARWTPWHEEFGLPISKVYKRALKC